MRNFLSRYCSLAFAILFYWCNDAHGQIAVKISDTAKQHIFRYGEVACFEEKRNLGIDEIKSQALAGNFKLCKDATPGTHDPGLSYWYRVNIVPDPGTKNNWMLEFFDQTIDSITVYSPDQQHRYSATVLGSSRPFSDRIYHHKNLR